MGEEEDSVQVYTHIWAWLLLCMHSTVQNQSLGV